MARSALAFTTGDPVDIQNPLDVRQCRARSKRSGKQCGRHAILGGRVCNMHGGKAPQVIKSATERLAELVDPAIVALGGLVEDAENDAIKLAAIKDVLDRAGFKPRERVEQSGRVVIEVVYGDDGNSSFTPPALSPAADQG